MSENIQQPGPVSRRRILDELPLLLQQEISIRRVSANDVVYTSKVMAIEGNVLKVTLPRGQSDHGYLRQSSYVIISFVIDGVLYDANARYNADSNQQREIIVDEDIVVSNRRNSERLPIGIETVYVPISDLSLTSGQLSNLKWRRCQTVDISSGGALLSMPIQAPMNSYFLLNLDIESFFGPLFIFSQMRWMAKGSGAQPEYQCGLMFIQAELLPRHFSKRAMGTMPAMMRGFTRKKQEELDSFLKSLSFSGHKGDADDGQ